MIAEAHVRGGSLALVLVCTAVLAGPATAQAPDAAAPEATIVDERPVPASATGELDESDVARSAAMIQDLGTVFGALAGREADAARRNDWIINQRIYYRAASLLGTMLARGQIIFRSLPAGVAAEVAGGNIVLDETLAGRWQPDALARTRKLGASDWADISRLTDVLIAQLALYDPAGGWDEWAAAHERASNLQDRQPEVPGRPMQALLLRYWHIQDKFVANALAAAGQESQGGGLQRAHIAALSNEMLVLLKQVEDLAGWRWREPLDALWRDRQSWARSVAAARSAPAPTETVEQTAPARSADFDELFAGMAETTPAPATAPETVEKTASPPAPTDPMPRESAARGQEAQDLSVLLRGLSGQVDSLAASVAEQRRELAALAEDVVAAGTAADSLAVLSARQATLERRIADLGREVGPDGLPRQVAELASIMESAESRSRQTEQRLESSLQERLRAVSEEIRVAQRQAADVRTGLATFRPSATAVEVRLQDAAAHRAAFRQVVMAGIALLVLLAAAIAFWVRGVRRRAATETMAGEETRAGDTAPGAAAPEPSEGEGLSPLMAGLHAAERSALRDELAQLRSEIESERGRAGDLEERLTQVTERLSESHARAERLDVDLQAVRAATQNVDKGLRDGVARDEAMGSELARLRAAITTEHERAAGLQALLDEVRQSAAPPAPHAPPAQPAPVDTAALRRRAIDALHRGDLPGFEEAFANLAALPLAEVKRIIRAPGGRELALACQAVDIAKPHYAAILILSRGARASGHRLEPRDLAQAMTVFDETSLEVAGRSLQGRRIMAKNAAAEPAGGMT